MKNLEAAYLSANLKADFPAHMHTSYLTQTKEEALEQG